MTTMHDALTARFDDADEIKDVANLWLRRRCIWFHLLLRDF
jgi:hypothetical protein